MDCVVRVIKDLHYLHGFLFCMAFIRVSLWILVCYLCDSWPHGLNKSGTYFGSLINLCGNWTGDLCNRDPWDDHCTTEKPHLIGIWIRYWRTLTSRSTAGVWFIQLKYIDPPNPAVKILFFVPRLTKKGMMKIMAWAECSSRVSSSKLHPVEYKNCASLPLIDKG